MSNPPRPLLALGNFTRQDKLSLAVAATEASFGAHFVSTVDEALRWLDEGAPHAVVVGDQGHSAATLCLEARARASHATLPILTLAREVDDLTFGETFSWGGDDLVIEGSVRSLVQRLRSLPLPTDGARPQTKGLVIVADPDRSRRITLGRVLRNAGYQIRFASTDEDVDEAARDGLASLVVVSSDLIADPTATVRGARTHGSTATWIYLCPPQRLAAHRAELESVGNATAADGFAPPENVVFLVNELTGGGLSDKRESRRLLYGTTVAFRGAGLDRSDYGYSYNISRGGLYVRTLAPPSEDLVWLELRPPRSDRRVHLEGQVVWRRPFGPSDRATVPPGFGVRIADATALDQSRWLDGYTRFAEALTGSTAVAA